MPRRSLLGRAEPIEAVISEMFEQVRLPDAWQGRIEDLANDRGTGVRADAERKHWEKQITRAREGFRSGLLEHEEAFVVDQSVADVATA